MGEATAVCGLGVWTWVVLLTACRWSFLVGWVGSSEGGAL